MRLKVPFLGYVLAGIAFLLPSVVLAAMLPFLINSQPIKAKLTRTLSEWTGAEVKLSGSMAVEDFFSLSVEARDVEIGSFKGLELIEGMRAERLVARIAWFDLLSGGFDFDKVWVSGAVVKARAAGPDEVAAALAEVVAGPSQTPFAAFQLEDGLLALRSAPRKPYRRLEVGRAKLRTAKGGQHLVGSANLVWKGQAVTLSLRSPFRSEPGAKLPVEIRAAGPLLSAQFKGYVLPGPAGAAEGDVVLRSPAFGQAAAWLGLGSVPGLPGGDVALSGAVAMTSQTLSLTSGAVTIGGQSAQASLTLERDDPLPRLEGALAFNGLDLKALMAGQSLADGVTTASAQSAMAEMDLRLSAKAVTWGGIETGPAALTLTARPSRLSAEIAELVLLGGELRGLVALEMAGPMARASARLSAEGVDAARLLRLADQRDWLSGAADLNVEAEAHWNDPAEITETLTAHARVNFPEGGQMRLDIPRLASSPALGGSGGWGDFEFTSAAFEHLRFDMALRDGQLSFSNLALTAAGRQVKGRGEIDLGARSLDWRFTLAPRTATGQDGLHGTVEDASGPALSIQGPWTRPVIRHRSSSGSHVRPDAHSAAALEIRPRQR
jgi:AsmA protein